MKNIDTLVEQVVNGRASGADIERFSRIVAHSELGDTSQAVEVILARLKTLSEENRAYREQHRRFNTSKKTSQTTSISNKSISNCEFMLRESQRLTQIGSWYYDFDTESFTVTDEVYRIYGRKPGKAPLTIDTLRRLVPPEDFAVLQHHYMEIKKNRRYNPVEFRILRPDGSIRCVRATGKLLYDDNNRLYRLIGCLQDITSFKKREQMLEQFKLCVDQAPDAVLWTNKSAQVTYANDQACRLLGYSRHELLALRLDKILGAFDHEFWKKRWAAGLSGQDIDVKCDQQWNRHKDGHFIPVSVSTTTCYEGDDTLRIAFVRDLTERKEIERRMIQSQKMEALGTLAGGVAHDFNNILAAIIGFADLARIGSDPDTTLHSYIEQIRTAADRAKHLVGQILLFSRRSPAEKKIVNIKSVISEVLELIRASIPATIEIQQNIVGCPGAVFADRTQIHQAIMNLCTNAYHAMKQRGGVLEISLEPIQVTESTTMLSGDLNAGQYVRITVADSGHGMDEQVLARVFEPYYTTKKAGEGTGMGLSTVLGIIKDHQGGIHAYSMPNVGTTFQLLLPLVDAVSNEPAVVDDRMPTGNERILFVDDEAPIVELTRELLSKLGYAVEAWTDADAAFAAFKQQPYLYDLLVTDIAMPKMSGDRFAAAVRSIRPELPIIICTGFSDRITDDIRRRLNIREILIKPVAAQELAQTIRLVLEAR